MRCALALVALCGCRWVFGIDDTKVGDAGTTASYDVVVVGAGTGGTAAAVAAARHGARVLLVEPSGWVGGQMASVPRIEDANLGTGVRTGFVEEVRLALVAHYAPGLSVEVRGPGTVSAEPHVVRDVFVAALAGAGVDIRLHTRVESAQLEGTTVTGVTLSDGTVVTSHVVIDATETGDVIPLTGAAYATGVDCVQSITYVAPIRKYGVVPAPLVIVSAPVGYDALPVGDYTADPTYSTAVHEGFQAAVVANAPGTVFAPPSSWANHNLYRVVPDSTGPPYTIDPASITRTSVNFANDYPPSAQGRMAGTLPVSYLEDPKARAAFDCAAKTFTLAFLYYAQHELGGEQGDRWSVANDEGFAEAGAPADCPDLPAELAPLAAQLPPTPYIRESRRIIAVHTLTGPELVRPPTAFVTSIARGWYPMDLHGCSAPGDLEPASNDASVSEAARAVAGGVQIPFESLIPIQVDGLLAAEKNIGVSRLANGTTRLEGVTMLTGQAAGTIAALAVAGNIQPREVTPFEVQRTLVAASDGLTPEEYTDVPPGDARWAAVQLIATHGLLVGASSTTFLPDTVLDRAHIAVPLAKVFRLVTDPPPATSDFGDVLTTDPFFKYIEAVFKAGLTAGCGAPNFCPNTMVTRAALAVFLAHGLAATLVPCTTPPFTDVTVGDPTCPAITWITAHHVMEPCAADMFCATDVVRRGDIAQPLVNVMALIGAPP